MTTSYVVTVDADTLLHPEALRRLVSRLETAPADTVAVAGSVLVRNSRHNFLTRMQEWDYFLGIAAVKRIQGLYQSTLVAQGAFSLYRTEHVRAIGGWPDAIGEDIVVTWRLMAGDQRIYFEPTAVAFTDVPTELRHFMRQRARWARGMFEGIRAVPPWRQSRVLSRLVAGIDLMIPLLDVGYALVFLPGLVLWALGYPVIVGFWTLLVLPGHRHRLRRAAPSPADEGVRAARPAGAAEPLRLPRVPPPLPGAVLGGVDRRVRPGDRRAPDGAGSRPNQGCSRAPEAADTAWVRRVRAGASVATDTQLTWRKCPTCGYLVPAQQAACRRCAPARRRCVECPHHAAVRAVAATLVRVRAGAGVPAPATRPPVRRAVRRRAAPVRRAGRRRVVRAAPVPASSCRRRRRVDRRGASAGRRRSAAPV